MWYASVVVTDLTGTPHTINPRTLGPQDALKLSLGHGKADVFSLSVEDYSGAVRSWLTRGCIVDIYVGTDPSPSTLVFHGMVEELAETWPLPETVMITASGRDLFSVHLDRTVTEGYISTEVSAIVADLLGKYAPAFTCDISPTAVIPDDIRFPYRPLREVLDTLATMSACTYRCTPAGVFEWRAAASESTGITYTAADLSPGVEKVSSLYPVKNRVTVIGGKYYRADAEQTTVAGTPKNLKDYWYAQSFVPTHAELDRVALHLKKTGAPATVQGYIYTDNSGPSVKIASFSKSADFMGTTADWVEFDVGVKLVAETKYWIVLKKDGDASNYVSWSHDNGSAGENAYSSNGTAWTRQTSSYRMAYKTLYGVRVIATRQDFTSGKNYVIREKVHKDEAVMSLAVARDLALSILNDLRDETPSLNMLRTRNQTAIPERGKLVTVSLDTLGVTASYVVQEVSFAFRGGDVGTPYMDVTLGKSEEALAEWLADLRRDVDRLGVWDAGTDDVLDKTAETGSGISVSSSCAAGAPVEPASGAVVASTVTLTVLTESLIDECDIDFCEIMEDPT